ncbi:MAG: UDP-N-acetylglucosamine 2-epimerase (non-hydrolyzing) [Chloroflexi bacterium]|nr:UDP-N-acetylglucosamine 2-epimerase (non-hydrolyzing) [Chloroflexota bacterium]
MNILSVVGARPEFVQAARLSKAIRTRHREVLVHTGQHYDYEMSEVFFQQLGLPRPDYNLGVGSGAHGWQTGEMMARMEKVIDEVRPDWTIVRGDTNSTLAGALAAAKLHIPVAHVEAGLRSFNRAMPEEINRIATDHISDLLFCPTQAAMDNLQREGLLDKALLVGDVMYEAILYSLALAQEQSDILARLSLKPRGYLLATVHRAENTDEPLRLAGILQALAAADEPVVFPVHPRTGAALKQHGLGLGGRVLGIPPVGYFDMLILEQNARLVLTDSGGVQKEAYCLGTPCITLREETEWVETVEAGWNTLVGVDPQAICGAVKEFQPPQARPLLYGDGHTSERIVQALEGYAP